MEKERAWAKAEDSFCASAAQFLKAMLACGATVDPAVLGTAINLNARWNEYVFFKNNDDMTGVSLDEAIARHPLTDAELVHLVSSMADKNHPVYGRLSKDLPDVG